jgi:hypothetical protein
MSAKQIEETYKYVLSPAPEEPLKNKRLWTEKLMYIIIGYLPSGKFSAVTTIVKINTVGLQSSTSSIFNLFKFMVLWVMTV